MSSRVRLLQEASRPPEAGHTTATRRTVFRRCAGAAGAGGLGALVAAACGPERAGPARPPASGAAPSGGFDWQKFRGTTIRAVARADASSDLVASLLPEFQQLTGITVDFQPLPGGDVREKITTEFVAGGSSIDAFTSTTAQDGLVYRCNNWYVPIERFTRDRSLALPDLDLDDFLPALRKSMRAPVGDQGLYYGLAFDTTVNLTYYNKDLYDRAGAPHPQEGRWTWAAVEETLKRLHRPDEGVSGWGTRQAGTGAVPYWLGIARSLGGGWRDAQGKLNLTTPENLEAFRLHAWLLRQYGVAQGDHLSLMNSGRVATVYDHSRYIADALRQVAPHLGYTLVPAGPKGASPFVFTWMWAVYSGSPSPRQEAAWYFVQWVTSRATQLKLALTGYPASRRSVYESAEFKAQDPRPEMTKVVLRAQEVPLADPEWLPPVVDVVPAREIIGNVMQVALEAGDYRPEAEGATRELQALEARQKAC
jgi:multiple sugar transport system substrate-binding protein